MSQTSETKFKETEIGMIPEDWEVISGETCMGLTIGRRPKGGITDKGSIPSLGGEHVDPVSHRINFYKSPKYIPKEFFLSMKRGKVDKEDILINKDGAYTGKIAFVWNLFAEEISINEHLFIIRSKNMDQKFLFYYLISRFGKFQIEQNITGSAQPGLNTQFIKKIKIPNPSNKEQEAIAKILSGLDIKIGLMQKQNKALEKIGNAFFKKWFINNPEKESWEVGKLGGYIGLDKGLSYKGAGLTKDKTCIPMANLGTFNLISGFKKEGLKHYCGEYKERNLVKPGDLIIANTDMTQSREILGSPAIIPYEINSDKVLFTHHTYAVRHKKNLISNYFLYFLLQTPGYRERAVGYATGTTVLALPKEAILDMAFALPPPEIMGKISIFLKDLFNKISMNNRQIKSLSKIRDSLLPKLMSGKIRVPIK
jgi:type I restriction enzyme, S subunit